MVVRFVLSERLVAVWVDSDASDIFERQLVKEYIPV